MEKDTELRFPVILPEEPGMEDKRLAKVLETALSGLQPCFLRTAEETAAWFLRDASPEEAADGAGPAEAACVSDGTAQADGTGTRRFRPVLFAVALGSDGVNLEYMRLLRLFRRREKTDPLTPLLLAVCAAAAASSLFSSGVLYMQCQYSFLFWIALGLLMRLTPDAAKQADRPEKETRGKN